MPKELREALDRTGLPWEVQNGKKHNKVKLVGRLVGVYPHGRKQEAEKRSLLNVITQVRHTAQEISSS